LETRTGRNSGRRKRAKRKNWRKPISRDLEIQEATDKVEYYLRESVIGIKHYSCESKCCSCEYKKEPRIYELQYYSSSFDMNCGVDLSGILEELEEKEKNKRD
ncbi:4488_t:CDS:1, partial [Cetraspora pellucida]